MKIWNMKSPTATRYSDSDLAEFKSLIESKLNRARSEVGYVQEQILDITEHATDDHGDWMEGASTGGDLEFLNDQMARYSKFIRELEGALIRIKNRNYGICEVSGELIDKKRLLAVPTARKSLIAKQAEQNEPKRIKDIQENFDESD